MLTTMEIMRRLTQEEERENSRKDLELPIPMSAGLEGLLCLPVPLSEEDWGKFKEAMTRLDGLKTLLVEGEELKTYEELKAMPASTRAEAIARLQAAETNQVYETPHMIADETLCELLRSLGYGRPFDPRLPSLMILTVGGIKGGSGKTTVATNLACIAATQNADVLLVDADDQENRIRFYCGPQGRLPGRAPL